MPLVEGGMNAIPEITTRLEGLPHAIKNPIPSPIPYSYDLTYAAIIDFTIMLKGLYRDGRGRFHEGYTCEDCGTIFFGSTLSDFMHPCQRRER
jgi:hypothetical protein